MKKENKEILVSILIIIVAILVGGYLLRRKVTPPADGSSAAADSSSSADSGTVPMGDRTFDLACDNNKSLTVTFHLPEDKSVDVTLSDGRSMSLDHVVSADGARYANADESIVLWNKGNNVFVTEGGTDTYTGCTINDAGTTAPDTSSGDGQLQQ